MSPQLKEGQVLLGRFVLGRRLHAHPSSELWFALDHYLDTQTLLRVYSAQDLSGGDVVDNIKRTVKQHRRFQHPGIGRVCDFHEDDQLIFVSIEASDGMLLAAVLEQDGPVHHRQAVERVRLPVEALHHLHENGWEHGRVDADHVLVDGDGRWILLPGDGTRPAGEDMLRLGHLLATAVTGGFAPEGSQGINDVVERLYGGRTVPALLDQLVSDLRIEDPALRPSGMRDVLRRLDQIQEFLGVVPAQDQDPKLAATTTLTIPADDVPDLSVVSRTRVGETSIAGGISATDEASIPVLRAARRRVPMFWLAMALIPVVLISGAMLVQPALKAMLAQPEAVKTTPETTDTVVEPPEDPQSSEPAPPPAAGSGPSAVTTPTPEADQALGRYLGVRRQADEIDAAAWGGEAFWAAVALAEAAEASYRAGRYASAAREYEEAASTLQSVIDSSDDALARLLADGSAAIEANDSEGASSAFRDALFIEPGNVDATIGLQRAATLDELNRLLAVASAHRAAGRLALAYAVLASAVELDPRSEVASARRDSIKERIADQQFRTAMSGGLDAFHRGDYDAARDALRDAKDMRPESVEVADAIEMVQQARLAAEVNRLHQLALDHEQQEQWQEARAAYVGAQAVDPGIQFAQEGQARCEQIITLVTYARHYLDTPERLLKRAGADKAAQVVAQLAALHLAGPKIRQLHDDLAEQVRLANTPIRVVLRSDGNTRVAVYKVKQYGTFTSMTLELLPGEYIVVGDRPGYKSVRLELRLKPGDTQATLEVVCVEAL